MVYQQVTRPIIPLDGGSHRGFDAWGVSHGGVDTDNCANLRERSAKFDMDIIGVGKKAYGENAEKRKGRGKLRKSGDIPLLPVCMQSTPSLVFFSLACRDLMSARVSIGLRPEFSAKAIGTASSASAKARIAYCSRPGLCRVVSAL
jgi:hypothetical protein